MAKLTKKAVDGAVSALGGEDRFLWDADIKGFGLKVTGAGSKVYMLQYRTPEAKTRRFTIGKHGTPWTCDEARGRAAELRAASPSAWTRRAGCRTRRAGTRPRRTARWCARCASAWSAKPVRSRLSGDRSDHADEAPRQARLRRGEASSDLEQKHGLTLAVATLAEYASIGGGPPFNKSGRFPLYEPAQLDAWAMKKLGPVRISTGDGR